MSRALRKVNWVEVKDPAVPVAPLPQPDRARFERYQERLPRIVLTNGHQWRLFARETEVRSVAVNPQWLLGNAPLTAGEEAGLTRFLRELAALGPVDAASFDEACQVLASGARFMYEAVIEAGRGEGLPAALSAARNALTESLRTNPEDPSSMSVEDFADTLAQTCTFGYLVARLRAGREIQPNNAFNHLDPALHPFLATSLHAVVQPDPALAELVGDILEIIADAVNSAAPQFSGDAGPWEKVPYAYEPFFGLFRPEDRLKYGVFYTSPRITDFQVSQIANLLRTDFGLRGLTDPAVRFLDPACGTGTYLLSLGMQAAAEAAALGLPVAATLEELFMNRVVGFEIFPGPASVAQARLEAFLESHGVRLRERLRVFIVNSLTPPAGAPAATDNLWLARIGQERIEGDRVKREVPVLVVLGNPPWGARTRETLSVTEEGTTRSLIAPWERGVDAAVINLYDLFVAFWRLACRFLLERPYVQPPRGIISFITNRSWIRGRAFGGMRRWLRGRDVKVAIVDLGGDIRAGAREDDEGVFAIQAGAAVAALLFGTDRNPGRVVYHRIHGRREEKLQRLHDGELGPQREVEGSGAAPFGPVDWGGLETATPIREFFARDFPGVKTHRDDLVVDVLPWGEPEDGVHLLGKMRRWNALPPEERRLAFQPSADRNAPEHYTVDQRYIVIHRYRPFDRRYLYADPLFVDRLGRRSVSKFFPEGGGQPALVTLDSRTTAGPVVIATTELPGYNSFRGSYETHIYPLAQSDDELALTPPPPVLSEKGSAWAAALGASPLEVGCYVLALGNAPSYYEAFAEGLEAEVPRFPMITDRDLFWACVAVGHTILRAWALDVGQEGIWRQTSRTGTPLGAARWDDGVVVFENGDRFEGLHQRAWTFSVSGYPVLQRWFEARSHLPLTPLIAEEARRIAASLRGLLGLQGECDGLLRRAIEAPRL